MSFGGNCHFIEKFENVSKDFERPLIILTKPLKPRPIHLNYNYLLRPSKDLTRLSKNL